MLAKIKVGKIREDSKTASMYGHVRLATHDSLVAYEIVLFCKIDKASKGWATLKLPYSEKDLLHLQIV